MPQSAGADHSRAAAGAGGRQGHRSGSAHRGLRRRLHRRHTAQAVQSMPGPITYYCRAMALHSGARSMHEAEKYVLERGAALDSDFLLWLNDDVDLDQASLQALLRAAEPRHVTVGATLDPGNGSVTYSGLRRSGLHPLGFQRVDPTGASSTVDTFNGNCVLVPVGLARSIGGIDGRFSHGLADIDYGLRCRRLNIPVVLAPRPIGYCARNPTAVRQSARHDCELSGQHRAAVILPRCDSYCQNRTLGLGCYLLPQPMWLGG